jgi:hypothetical protein
MNLGSNEGRRLLRVVGVCFASGPNVHMLQISSCQEAGKPHSPPGTCTGLTGLICRFERDSMCFAIFCRCIVCSSGFACWWTLDADLPARAGHPTGTISPFFFPIHCTIYRLRLRTRGFSTTNYPPFVGCTTGRCM